MFKNILMGCGALAIGGFALLVVAGIIGAMAVSDDEEPEVRTTPISASSSAVADPTDEPDETPVPVLPANQAQIGNLLLTVNGVAPHTDDLFPAEAGTHYVAVDVTGLNNGDKEYGLNVLNFHLQDSDGFTTSYAITDKEPIIGHHDLVPGQSVRGFIVFKLGDGRTPVELQYQSFTGTPGRIPIN